MVVFTDLASPSEWTCIPTGWEEVSEIKIFLIPNCIQAIYQKQFTTQKETFYYDSAVQDNEGLVRLSGTPFSILKFNSENRMLISRKSGGSVRPFTYIFYLVRQTVPAGGNSH